MKMFKTSTVKVPVDLGGREGKKGILLVGSSVQSVGFSLVSQFITSYLQNRKAVTSTSFSCQLHIVLSV